ncbi:hypothetical protein EVAR_9425_1 [Eumeta japonica]|uniref:Uncharacterized protein n=1 Tax=Eumeta variegata TaxID=151549 RepID=A0A4C1UDX7_EUMVA|nr:hypothetical protein EVAR_9425_1 [Eumeta japonica]
MLSLYYVFFWEPKDSQHAQRQVSQTVQRPPTTSPLPTCFMPHTGVSLAYGHTPAQYNARNCLSDLSTNDIMRRFNASPPFVLFPRVPILRHCDAFEQQLSIHSWKVIPHAFMFLPVPEPPSFIMQESICKLTTASDDHARDQRLGLEIRLGFSGTSGGVAIDIFIWFT